MFADEVFPCIDEQPFRVMYSEKASRPNTPVSVILGGLILKELLGMSDDELLENLISGFTLSVYTAHDRLRRAADERQDTSEVPPQMRKCCRDWIGPYS